MNTNSTAAEREALVAELREASLLGQQTAWSRIDGGQAWSLVAGLADRAADAIEVAEADMQRLTKERDEASASASLGCDAANGDAHSIIVHGKYQFCYACGETIRNPTLHERARAAEAERDRLTAEVAALREASAAATGGEAVSATEADVLRNLIDVARSAFNLLDDTGDDGDELTVERSSFEAASLALDKLDALPDDQPGYTMGPAAKAEWALRRLLDPAAALLATDGGRKPAAPPAPSQDVSALSQGVDRLRGFPQTQQSLSKFVDLWGLDSYDAGPETTDTVRQIVKAFLAASLTKDASP